MIKSIVRDYTRHLFESPEDIIEKLIYFREFSARGLHVLSDQQIEDLAAEFNQFFNLNLAFFADTYPTKLFRVTNNKYLCSGRKQKLQKLTDLIGPPEGMSNIGRCNLKGESVFYSALDFNTAVWETQPETGDYITISQWKIKEGQKINTHSIFHPEITNLSKDSINAYDGYIEAQKKMHPHHGACFHEILKFLCDEFMKPVDSDKKINYLFSAIISSRFLQAKPDSNGFRIDAISYPSIKKDYGVTNLAMTNSLVFEKLELESLTIYDIGQTNYDNSDKTRKDLILVSPLELKITEFDFDANQIKYNPQEELRLAMQLVDNLDYYQKTGNSSA